MGSRFFIRRVLAESFKRLNTKERMLFYTAGIVCIVSGLGLFVLLAASRTIVIPAEGGSYTEGIVGGPRFINPVLAHANDTDRDLVKLIFAGLVTYDVTGRITPDLAESYTVSTDTKTLTFVLRDNLAWHDGAPFTVDDVLFTIRLLQTSDYQSPLRFVWQGVEAKKLDSRTLSLILPGPHASFLSNATVGILPKHIWQNVPSQAFGLDEANFNPVGSGPFRFKSIEREKGGQINAITLERNSAFHRTVYLDRITVRFYESTESALDAFKRGEIDGMGLSSPIESGGRARTDVIKHALDIPRIFAVFFNQNQSKALSKREVRTALEFAVNKVSLAEKLYGGQAELLYGPLPASVFGYTDKIDARLYNKKLAVETLEKAGWKLQPDGTRELKEKQKVEKVVGKKKVLQEETVTTTLEFTLLTANVPDLEEAAETLQAAWEDIGARVNVEIAGVADIQGERVRPRLYDAVLFGQVLALDPDPFPFWHSSQRRDPGLNIALYQNPKVDRALQNARVTAVAEERAELLADFQKMVVEDAPAIFLFSPKYFYPVSRNIRGIQTKVVATPSERFSDVSNWYVKTNRVWR